MLKQPSSELKLDQQSCSCSLSATQIKIMPFLGERRLNTFWGELKQAYVMFSLNLKIIGPQTAIEWKALAEPFPLIRVFTDPSGKLVKTRFCRVLPYPEMSTKVSKTGINFVVNR